MKLLCWDGMCKWRSCSVSVQGVELKSAANMLADHIKISFRMSAGWLLRFCKQCGIMNRGIYREALSALSEETEPLRQTLTKILDNRNFLKSWIYDVVETGLFWHSLSENAQAYRHVMLTPKRKIRRGSQCHFVQTLMSHND
jgi:hypothetical protein